MINTVLEHDLVCGKNSRNTSYVREFLYEDTFTLYCSTKR
jgi:hypothetical protein